MRRMEGNKSNKPTCPECATMVFGKVFPLRLAIRGDRYESPS